MDEPNPFDILYLDPTTVRVERDPVNDVPRIQMDDRCHLRVGFSRAFPFSDPSVFIALLDQDGKEIGVFKTLDGMDEASRSIIDQALDRRYFTPKAHHIYTMRKESDVWRIEAATDRGDRTFYVRHWRDNAHEIAPRRWLVNAVDGARFEIPDVEALDPRSQAFLDQLA